MTFTAVSNSPGSMTTDFTRVTSTKDVTTGTSTSSAPAPSTAGSDVRDTAGGDAASDSFSQWTMALIILVFALMLVTGIAIMVKWQKLRDKRKTRRTEESDQKASTDTVLTFSNLSSDGQPDLTRVTDRVGFVTKSRSSRHQTYELKDLRPDLPLSASQENCLCAQCDYNRRTNHGDVHTLHVSLPQDVGQHVRKGEADSKM